jgi:hypothetical protein
MAGKEKRINIYLTDKTHTEAKVVSVLKHHTLNAFLEQAIADAVEKDKRLLKELVG